MEENGKLLVSPSPHMVGGISTRTIMLGVCVALLPTLIAASFIFGIRVLLLTGVTVAACVGFEALYCLVMKRPIPIGDFSAVVTGLILAFNLPPSFPLWMACLGAFVAIVITKQLFGGLGFNFANPALVGRIVLQLSFTSQMINYTEPVMYGGPDAIASATPLLTIQTEAVPIMDLLLGTHGGVLGETCALTLILGGLFLIFTKIISPIIPLVYIGGMYAFKFLLEIGGGAALGVAAWDGLIYILSGGLLLGAFFMATDYTTSPYTRLGRVIYALLLAVITAAIREWSNMLEGVSFTLLFMNLLVPYLNSICRQRPLGVKRKKAKPEKAALSAGKGAK